MSSQSRRDDGLAAWLSAVWRRALRPPWELEEVLRGWQHAARLAHVARSVRAWRALAVVEQWLYARRAARLRRQRRHRRWLRRLFEEWFVEVQAAQLLRRRGR